MNYPAFRAGTRTSPIDKGNMNRSFPGRPDGTVTEKIADYFQRELLLRADIVLDFHSGGKTLDFMPFCAAHVLPDKALEKRAFAAVEAFSAPFSVKMLEIDTVGMYDTAAEEMGKVFVTTELGGGGTSRAETVRIARRGVLNVLRHAGIVSGAVEKNFDPLARHAIRRLFRLRRGRRHDRDHGRPWRACRRRTSSGAHPLDRPDRARTSGYSD